MDRDALSEYFFRVHSKPSILGRLDCVRFVIEAIYVGWGKDFRDVLGYDNRRSAVERLRISGGLEQAFSDELGEPVPAQELVPGDIAYFDDPAVGLVLPNYVAVKFRRTIVRTPITLAAKGWHTWVR